MKFLWDERTDRLSGKIATVFLGLTQVGLLAIILYRRYYLGQAEDAYSDVRVVLAFSVFGYIAARLYFGKQARDLTLAESALLAAIIHSPNRTSPHRAAERAASRRDLVLDLMRGQGRIGEQEYARALEEPLHLANVTPDPGDARYFLDPPRSPPPIPCPMRFTASAFAFFGFLPLTGLALTASASAATAMSTSISSLKPEFSAAISRMLCALRGLGSKLIVEMVSGRYRLMIVNARRMSGHGLSCPRTGAPSERKNSVSTSGRRAACSIAS